MPLYSSLVGVLLEATAIQVYVLYWYMYIGNASSVAKEEREWGTSYASSGEESDSGTGDELSNKTKGRRKRRANHKDDKVFLLNEGVLFHTCTFSCYMYLVLPLANYKVLL